MSALLHSETWHSLVPALLHTLWIGAAAAVVLAAVLWVIPAARGNLRYGCSLLALCAVLAGGVLAWAWQEQIEPSNQADRPIIPASRQAHGPTPAESRRERRNSRTTFWIRGESEFDLHRRRSRTTGAVSSRPVDAGGRLDDGALRCGTHLDAAPATLCASDRRIRAPGSIDGDHAPPHGDRL